MRTCPSTILAVALCTAATFSSMDAEAAALRIPPRAHALSLTGTPAPVIVELAVDTQADGLLAASAGEAQRSAIAATQAGLLAQLGGSARVHRQYKYIPFVALSADPAALTQLWTSDLVRSITDDEAREQLLLQSVPIVQADVLQSLGIDGTGTTVAILDSGTEAGHPFFEGRVIEEACFTQGTCIKSPFADFGPFAADPYPADPDGHGTHVAGIAAGAQGVAPGSSIIAIQVFTELFGAPCGVNPSPCYGATDSDVIAALEYVYELSGQYRIAAANLSLGSSVHSAVPCDASQPAYKAAFDLIRSANIAPVVAAGNEGVSTGIATPACLSNAISVGATTDADMVASFSNSASNLSLLAPGVSIESSVPGGGFDIKGGTSMAAPHVAGAWALLRQVAPTATISQILSALQTTGKPVFDSRNGVTKSRIEINDARIALVGTGPCIPDIDTLCLRGGRFKVEIDWRAPNGSSGQARVRSFDASDSGLFYFTNPNNLEFLVKILNGCASTSRYWVFFAATTTVEFTLQVTDTMTGAQKTYLNPLGNPANAVTDTQAFATCP